MKIHLYGGHFTKSIKKPPTERKCYKNLNLFNLYKHILNFNVDTENKISSSDMNDELNPDKIILHGLWPDAELLEPSFGEEISWQNQLLKLILIPALY